jgi:hypothetical protein
MTENQFKIIADYGNNRKQETIMTSETPKKAIEKAIRENHLPLNFIDNLPIFWMNYDPTEKQLQIIESDKNYKILLVHNHLYQNSIFHDKESSNCDIELITVEKI